MGKVQVGPRAAEQLRRLRATWKQGQHVIITGGTGSGKTRIARELDQIRIDNGGFVCVLIAKLLPDDTISDYYSRKDGWIRWTTWHKRPRPYENKILLWPKVEGLPVGKAIPILREEHGKALQAMSASGRWTTHIDEGLLTCDPQGLNLAAPLNHMSNLIRSAHGTLIVLAQRPANLPLVLYSNASHAFVSRTSELADMQRMAGLNPMGGRKELEKQLQNNKTHDFTWVPVGTDAFPERFNLAE